MKGFIRTGDKGVSAMMVAMALFLLVGSAAVAVDLAAMRADRSADQKVTDSAASAAAIAIAEGGAGREACEAAIAYVTINSDGIPALSDSGCVGAFQPACAIGDSHTVTSGRFTITIAYPVPDGHPLMTSGALGAPTQAVVAEDGNPCDRVGVEMSAVHDGLFASVLGFDQGTTTVHTVARSFLPGNDGPPLNLVVLDRFGCNGIHVRGQGGVIVNKIVDPATSNEFPGLAAADSDASSGCAPSVLLAEGQGLIRSDGPAGCVSEVTPGTGEGCGLIQTLAPGTPGCSNPACQVNGLNAKIIPDPTPLPQRLTRAPIDYEYNCWVDYTMPLAGSTWAADPLTTANEQDIPGCPDPANAHIYQLLAAVGPSGSAGNPTWPHPCNVASSQSFTFNGSVFVDCADFVVEGNVTINAGNVIFGGNVHVKSTGGLRINPAGASCPTPNNTDQHWVVFRNGRFKKDGQASLIIEHTAVYLSKTSWTEIAGGASGQLCWTAPDTGNFDDLALWSDSPLTHFWSGQGDLDMVGVFFIPRAKADYSGTSSQNQTKAQWIADKLEAHGQGVLRIQPAFEFPFKQDGSARSVLIR